MRYHSTRGGVTGASFEAALLSGYASDGGMFLPEIIPSLSKEQLRAWALLTYPQVVEEVLKLFVSTEELSHAELHGEHPILHMY